MATAGTRTYNHARSFVLLKSNITVDQYQRLVKNCQPDHFGGTIVEFENAFIVSTKNEYFAKLIMNPNNYSHCIEISSTLGIDVSGL